MHDDDAVELEELIRYCYIGNFGKAADDRASRNLPHHRFTLQMFTIGDKYDVPGLRELELRKIIDDATRFTGANIAEIVLPLISRTSSRACMSSHTFSGRYPETLGKVLKEIIIGFARHMLLRCP